MSIASGTHTTSTSAGPRLASRSTGSPKAEGDLVDAIPEGYEVYENPDAQVYLRKIVPQIVTPEEVAVVKEGLKRFAPGQNCLVDVRKADIIVYHSKRGSLYQKMLRFTLDDKKDRTFRVQRWCFRGSIDDWIDLWMSGGSGSSPFSSRVLPPHRAGFVLRTDVIDAHQPRPYQTALAVLI